VRDAVAAWGSTCAAGGRCIRRSSPTARTPHGYVLEGTRGGAGRVPGVVARRRTARSASVADAARNVERAGLVPILAHPERCPPVAADPASVRRLAEAGWPLCLNGPSLTGDHGETASGRPGGCSRTESSRSSRPTRTALRDRPASTRRSRPSRRRSGALPLCRCSTAARSPGPPDQSSGLGFRGGRRAGAGVVAGLEHAAGIDVSHRALELAHARSELLRATSGTPFRAEEQHEQRRAGSRAPTGRRRRACAQCTRVRGRTICRVHPDEVIARFGHFAPTLHGGPCGS
jgi:hypothetical protein